MSTNNVTIFKVGQEIVRPANGFAFFEKLDTAVLKATGVKQPYMITDAQGEKRAMLGVIWGAQELAVLEAGRVSKMWLVQPLTGAIKTAVRVVDHKNKNGEHFVYINEHGVEKLADPVYLYSGGQPVLDTQGNKIVRSLTPTLDNNREALSNSGESKQAKWGYVTLQRRLLEGVKFVSECPSDPYEMGIFLIGAAMSMGFGDEIDGQIFLGAYNNWYNHATLGVEPLHFLGAVGWMASGGSVLTRTPEGEHGPFSHPKFTAGLWRWCIEHNAQAIADNTLEMVTQ